MRLFTILSIIGLLLCTGYATYFIIPEYKMLQHRYQYVYDELRRVSRESEQDQDYYQRALSVYSHQIDALCNDVKPATILKDVYVTAYAPMDNQSGICADETPTTTSTMVHPGWGYVAVNPDLIPYGTVLYIPGYGTAIAADTGYAVRTYNGIQIDVYMDTYDQAIQWGTQTLDVIVLDTLKKEDWVGLKLIKEEANE